MYKVVKKPLLLSFSKLMIGAKNAANVFPVPVGELINISFPSIAALNDKILMIKIIFIIFLQPLCQHM